MKRHKQLRLAWLILALLSLFISAPASATSYDCDGGPNPVPASVSGSVEITSSGDCTIGHNVTATGTISIIASTITIQGLTTPEAISLNVSSNPDGTILANGDFSGGYISVFGKVLEVQNMHSSVNIDIYAGNGIKTKDIISDNGGVYLLSQGAGSIEVNGLINSDEYVYVDAFTSIKIDGDITSISEGAVQLKAGGEISTQDITGSLNGNIIVKANTRLEATPFYIGGTYSTNGINGTVTSQWTSYITNGASDSQADMTLLDPTKFVAGGGYIILNAQQGTLHMPSGTLSVDGAPAGQIQLLAKTVSFGDGAVLSAINTGIEGHLHGVAIAAETITYQGAGLKILADGDGIDNNTNAFAYLLANGATNILESSHPTNPTITVENRDNIPGPLNVQGDGVAPLKITANGDHATTLVWAYPISFSGGAVTLESKGKIDHSVYIHNNIETFSELPGLTFANMGAVKIDASGIGGDAGSVDVLIDQFVIDAPSLEIKSEGPLSGNGGGGLISVNTTGVVLNPQSKASVITNGATAGSGAGGAIIYSAANSSLPIGLGEGQMSFSSKGGINGGDGGVVQLSTGLITVFGATAESKPIDVSVSGASGDGGKIEIEASLGLVFDGVASYLKADSGEQSGNGGTIYIDVSGSVTTVGTSSTGAVDLSAKSIGNGAGGTIAIFSDSEIAVDSAHIAVDAKNEGDGGTIVLNAGYSQLTLNGDLVANGGLSNGIGGIISVSSGTLTLPALSNTALIANGHGAGKGGKIELVSTFGDLSIGFATAQVRLEAKTDGTVNGNADGGQIDITAFDNLLIDGSNAIDVSAGSNGTGGKINVHATNGALQITGEVLAKGNGVGDGGEVRIDGSGIVSVSGGIDVRADGNGKGGLINIRTTDGALELTGDFIAKGNEEGAGGKISLSGNSVNLGTGLIDASSGLSGSFDGGLDEDVTITSATNLTLAEGLVVRAQGGVNNSALSGGINVSSQGNVIIDALLNVDNEAVGGTAGHIIIEAGTANDSGSIAVNGQLWASGLVFGSQGGGIELTYSDFSGESPVFVTGSMRADQSSEISGLHGHVSFHNRGVSSVAVIVNNLISADNGEIIAGALTAGTPDLTISGSGQMIGALSVDHVHDADIELGIGSITIDHINTESDPANFVKITTQDGDILSATEAQGINAIELQLDTAENIGSIASNLQTSVQYLSVKADRSATGSSFINNRQFVGTLVLANDAASSMDFSLSTVNSLEMDSVRAGRDSSNQVHPGSIFIRASGSNITIGSNAFVHSFGGAVEITSYSPYTKLVVGNGASILSDGINDLPGFVNISLSMPPSSLPIYNGLDPNFVLQTSEAPFIGLDGFIANAPPSTCAVGAAGMILYGPYQDSITFNGGNAVVGQ